MGGSWPAGPGTAWSASAWSACSPLSGSSTPRWPPKPPPYRRAPGSAQRHIQPQHEGEPKREKKRAQV